MSDEPSEVVFELRKTARENRQTSMPLIFVDGKFMKTEEFNKNIIGA